MEEEEEGRSGRIGSFHSRTARQSEAEMEIFWGTLSFAVIAGVLFARVSSFGTFKIILLLFSLKFDIVGVAYLVLSGA